MLLKYINLKIFLISFTIGLFFVYALGPEMKKVYIYPSPETANNIIFKDKAGNCFKYDEIEVDCPQNEDDIFSIPMQI